jgi:hypothetical protein
MIKRVVAPLSASVDKFRENVTLDSQPQAGVLANFDSGMRRFESRRPSQPVQSSPPKM